MKGRARASDQRLRTQRAGGACGSRFNLQHGDAILMASSSSSGGVGVDVPADGDAILMASSSDGGGVGVDVPAVSDEEWLRWPMGYGAESMQLYLQRKPEMFRRMLSNLGNGLVVDTDFSGADGFHTDVTL